MPSTKPGRELVKQYMSNNNIKISDLAKFYGMSKQEVSNYLNGTKQNPAGNKFILKVIQDFKVN